MESSAIDADVRPEAPNPSPARPSARRGWWQFSLFSLLLLFVIACLIAGYVGQSRRMEEARRQIAERDETIKRLRQELGIDEDVNSPLNVQDPTKLHVAALPCWEDDTWRWKVFLPPGQKWRIGIDLLETTNAAEPPKLMGGGGSNIGDDGELVMEARLLRDLKGFPQIQVRRPRGGTRHGSIYLDEQFKAKGKVRVQQAGLPKQVIVPPGERVEILRRTVLMEPQADSGESGAAANKQGAIVIYLEEDLRPAAAKKNRKSSSK